MVTLNDGVGTWFIAFSSFGNLRDYLRRLLELDALWWNPFSLNQVWNLVLTDRKDVFYY